MTTRKELIGGVGARYRSAPMSEKSKILDEFVAITGYHRKHAIRVLGAEADPGLSRPTRNRLYDEAVRQALIVLWEAGDRVCGKRLKALIPILIGAMERHGHLDLDAEIKAKLLQVSAATIDRALGDARSRVDGQRKRRTGVGAAIRRSIPVPTFSDWRDPPPGFLEVRSGSANLNSALGGNSGHDAGPRMAWPQEFRWSRNQRGAPAARTRRRSRRRWPWPHCVKTRRSPSWPSSSSCIPTRSPSGSGSFWSTRPKLGGGAAAAAEPVDLDPLHAKIGQLTLENDFLERALTKAGLLSAKR